MGQRSGNGQGVIQDKWSGSKVRIRMSGLHQVKVRSDPDAGDLKYPDRNLLIAHPPIGDRLLRHNDLD